MKTQSQPPAAGELSGPAEYRTSDGRWLSCEIIEKTGGGYFIRPAFGKRGFVPFDAVRPAAGAAAHTQYQIHVFTDRCALSRKDSGGCLKIVASFSDYTEESERAFIVRACNSVEKLERDNAALVEALTTVQQNLKAELRNKPNTAAIIEAVLASAKGV